MIKAILYDMDGTVLDTMPIYEAGWRYADTLFGCGGEAVAMLPQLAGMNNADSEAFVRSRIGADFPYEEFRRTLRQKMEEIISDRGIACKAGAPDIFARMRAIGMRQVLVTSSSPTHVFPYLTMAGIENVFDAVVTGDMVTHSKPDPEIYLIGAARAGCEPCECVVVEDAANGARAGIAAGMKTVMIPEYPPIPADIMQKLWHECKDLAELADLIEQEYKNCETQ